MLVGPSSGILCGSFSKMDGSGAANANRIIGRRGASIFEIHFQLITSRCVDIAESPVPVRIGLLTL
jgi:hypothetical protein